MDKKSSSNFRFGKVIGEGSFSTVYIAKEISSGKEYASKLRKLRFHSEWLNIFGDFFSQSLWQEDDH